MTSRICDGTFIEWRGFDADDPNAGRKRCIRCRAFAGEPCRSPNNPEPPPRPSDETPVWDLVMADIRERDARGTEKYGQRLTPGDGRDSLVDAYQEALDLVVYLRKAIAERAETDG